MSQRFTKRFSLLSCPEDLELPAVEGAVKKRIGIETQCGQLLVRIVHAARSNDVAAGTGFTPLGTALNCVLKNLDAGHVLSRELRVVQKEISTAHAQTKGGEVGKAQVDGFLARIEDSFQRLGGPQLGDFTQKLLSDFRKETWGDENQPAAEAPTKVVEAPKVSVSTAFFKQAPIIRGTTASTGRTIQDTTPYQVRINTEAGRELGTIIETSRLIEGGTGSAALRTSFGCLKELLPGDKEIEKIEKGFLSAIASAQGSAQKRMWVDHYAGLTEQRFQKIQEHDRKIRGELLDKFMKKHPFASEVAPQPVPRVLAPQPVTPVKQHPAAAAVKKK